MKSIFVHHHLGLGDHIICNGLVRGMLQRESPDYLYLAVKKRNMGTVTGMFRDDRRIICLPVDSDAEAHSLPQKSFCSSVYRVGFERIAPNWDMSFYECVDLPFEYRWSHFRVCRDDKREKKLVEKLRVSDGERFILVHRQGSDKRYEIEVETVVRAIEVEPITDSLLDWCGLIERAEEVHCIDSSFIHLAQSLKVKSGFFHDIRKSVDQFRFALLPSWGIVHY